MLKAINRNGLILDETPTTVTIVTGLKRRSKNVKTGGVLQIWILVKAENPIAAVQHGSDAAVCFGCPLRGTSLGDRVCYVDLAKAPLAMWRCYNRGGYERFTGDYSVFANQFVRFGAYGEPVLIPYGMVERIASVASGWTGYSHQWANPLFASYARYFMASTNASDYEQAQALGWRTFTVSADKLDKQVVCPASKEAGHRVSCVDCGLCAGTARVARSIQIQPHGNGANHADDYTTLEQSDRVAA